MYLDGVKRKSLSNQVHRGLMKGKVVRACRYIHVCPSIQNSCERNFLAMPPQTVNFHTGSWNRSSRKMTPLLTNLQTSRKIQILLEFLKMQSGKHCSYIIKSNKLLIYCNEILHNNYMDIPVSSWAILNWRMLCFRPCLSMHLLTG